MRDDRSSCYKLVRKLDNKNKTASKRTSPSPRLPSPLMRDVTDEGSSSPCSASNSLGSVHVDMFDGDIPHHLAMSELLSVMEPRPIEEMFAAPDRSNWYELCATLTPRQQAMMEYSLPMTLPTMFYILELSRFGVAWCVVIVIGHTLETLFTGFGPSARDLNYKPVIAPLEHNLIDCMWLHTLISAMIIGPHHFGPGGFYLGLVLTQTLPIYLAVSFKTHFQINWLEKADEVKQKDSFSRQEGMIKCMGNMIRRLFHRYFLSVLCVYVGHLVGSFNIRLLGVFLFNLAPLLAGEAYKAKFSKSQSSFFTKGKLL